MKWLWLLALVSLAGCTPPALEGPPADLTELAKPDPVSSLVRERPKPAPGPMPTSGFFRAWIPRQTAVNGDTVDGHFVTISTTPPAAQVLDPVHTIPRPPKSKAPKPKPPTIQVPVSQLPPGTLPPDVTGSQPEGER